MTLEEILKIVTASEINPKELAEALDALDHDERVAATRRFNTRIQKNLYGATEGQDVTVDHLVPHDATNQEVIHHGTNTLPAFRQFQKRFARPTDPENRDVVGYNHNWYQFATSPGYFVGSFDPDVEEFIIDYTQLPTEKDPNWPKIISNKFGLGIFVWTGMKDRVRKVSDHVTIGRAFRGDKPMNAYFVLVRED